MLTRKGMRPPIAAILTLNLPALCSGHLVPQMTAGSTCGGTICITKGEHVGHRASSNYICLRLLLVWAGLNNDPLATAGGFRSAWDLTTLPYKVLGSLSSGIFCLSVARCCWQPSSYDPIIMRSCNNLNQFVRVHFGPSSPIVAGHEAMSGLLAVICEYINLHIARRLVHRDC